MSLALRLNLIELDQLADRFEAAGESARDKSELMDRIGMAMEASTQDNFEGEHAPDGTPWAPSLRAKLDGGKTLTDSGRLSDSVTHRSTSDSVEIGSNLIYAGVHQDGATIHAKSSRGLAFQLPGGLGLRRPQQVIIPQRQFLGIGNDDEQTIVELADDWLTERLAI